MKIEDLADMIRQKKGQMGVRAAAAEIGISPTTLSRIERGHVPDVATLNKVCAWLEEEPEQFTGVGDLQIAFKNNRTTPPEVAKSLANLIEKASLQFAESIQAEGHET